jgi:hypothetical protein
MRGHGVVADTPQDRPKEVIDAIEADRFEAPALDRSVPGHHRARSGCPLQASLGNPRKERMHMLRKLMYSLGALAMLALAVGAGFKPN